MIDNTLDTLVLAGGGVRCIATIGALNVLQNQKCLEKIKKYAGTSAGSIIVTLLNIGYSPNEIYDTVFSQTNSIVHDSIFKVPYNILMNYGIYSGNKMFAYLQHLFITKGFNKDITFNELFSKTGKVLVITATSLNTRNTFFFNYQTFPDMKVVDAVRMSISIPFFFASVNYSLDGVNHRFVDGGVLNNFPLYYFDVSEIEGHFIKTYNELVTIHSNHSNVLKYKYKYNTIGIMLLDQYNNSSIFNYFSGFDKINNICDFITSFINTILNKIDQDNFHNPLSGAKTHFFDRTIAIHLQESISAINFDLSQKTKGDLLKWGETSANKFLDC